MGDWPGSRGELAFPRAVPARWLRDGAVASRMRVRACGLPVTYSTFLFLLDLHFLPWVVWVFFPPFFTWWLLVGAIRRRMRALPPAVFPGSSGASASGTDPASEIPQCVRKPHQGSMKLAWIPGLASRAAAHAISGQGSWRSPSLVLGWGRAQHSLGVLPLVLLEP